MTDDPAILTLGARPGNKNPRLHTKLYPDTPSSITHESRRVETRRSTRERRDARRAVCTLAGTRSTTRKKEILTRATTHTNPEHILFGASGQAEKERRCVVPRAGYLEEADL